MIWLIKHFSQKWLFEQGHDLFGVVLRLWEDGGFEVVFDFDGGLEDGLVSFAAGDLDVRGLTKKSLVLVVVVFQGFHYFG